MKCELEFAQAAGYNNDSDEFLGTRLNKSLVIEKCGLRLHFKIIEAEKQQPLTNLGNENIWPFHIVLFNRTLFQKYWYLNWIRDKSKEMIKFKIKS